VAHDVVQQRVDAGGQVVEDPGDIGHHRVDKLVLLPQLGPPCRGVDGNQSLRVEGGPAQEEAHHHGHWWGKKGVWQ